MLDTRNGRSLISSGNDEYPHRLEARAHEYLHRLEARAYEYPHRLEALAHEYPHRLEARAHEYLHRREARAYDLGRIMATSPADSKPRNARERSRWIVGALTKKYGDAECALVHETPLQLLIATILSAQCTDERVNMVTPALFKRFRTASDFADAELSELEDLIRSTGFFRSKSKSIKACCQALVENHGGEVPGSLEELVKLAGIGRKTANVVLGTAMGKATGVVVDTHVKRLSNRMGLTRHSDPVKIERVLMKLLPRDEWIQFSHRMIHHGRQTCMARNPDCDHCVIAEVCPQVGVRRKR